MSSKRVGIVGAGVGGLRLAGRLIAAGAQPIVFEQAGTAGGVIRSLRVEGRILEAGPQRLRLTPVLRHLVDETGLASELMIAPRDLPLFLYRSGRLSRAPLSLSALIRSDLLSFGAKLRLLLESASRHPRADETVADYLSRRFGRSAYRHLLGPLFGGLYASDPGDMLARHALMPLLRDLGAEGSIVALLARRALRRAPTPPAATFRHGLKSLTDAMAAGLGDRLRLHTRVDAVRRTGRWLVLETEAGDVEVDRVVLTTPAAATSAILRVVDRDVAGRLSRLRYNRLAMVYLLSAAPLRGLGFQTSFSEGMETRGVTFNGATFPEGREGLFTVFLGGSRNATLADADDDALSDLAVREFAIVSGHGARAIHTERAEIPAWDGTWTSMDGLRVPEGIHLCANYESRVGIGGRLARAESLAFQLTTEFHR